MDVQVPLPCLYSIPLTEFVMVVLLRQKSSQWNHSVLDVAKNIPLFAVGCFWLHSMDMNA